VLSSEEEKTSVRGRRRREERVFALEPVELSDLKELRKPEPTVAQNISAHGARVTTQRVWEPGSFLLIKSVRGTFKARARVVYWRSFSSSRFTIGLEFLSCEGKWPKSD
jgi:PilZ domain-containing protein